MAQDYDDNEEDGGGFDVDDWARLKPFIGAVATLEDYGGLDIWSWTPGFEPVDSVGRTTLYRITACE